MVPGGYPGAAPPMSTDASRAAATAPASLFSTGRSPACEWSPRSSEPRCSLRLTELRMLMAGGLHAGAGAARRPLGELEPVRLTQRLDDARIRVRRVEDVPLEVAADRDVRKGNALDVDERVGRELRLGDGVVLELEIRCDLHQTWPVWAGARAHEL